MFYYIQYDIAGILLCATVLAFYFTKKHFSDSLSKIYVAMLVTTIETGIFDILSAYSINNKMHSAFVMSFTSLYYLSTLAVTYLFLAYVLFQLQSEEDMSMLTKHLLKLPISYFVIIVIINDFTGWLFTYNTVDGYKTGPLHFLSYVVSFFYYLWAMLYSTKKKNFINKSLRLNFFNICLINITFIIVQPFMPDKLIVGFGFALGMVVLAFSPGKRTALLDQRTGMLNREELSNTVGRYYYNERKFDAILVRVADYDQITNVYGIQLTETLVSKIACDIVAMFGVGKSYQTNNSTFVVIFDDGRNIDEVVNEIHTKLSSAYEVDGQMISFSHLITHVSCPLRARNIDAFLACLTYFEKMKRMRYGIVPSEELHVRDRVRETAIERAIKEGLTHGNMSVHYQPICVAENTDFVTAEALVRLKDPQLGFVSPAEFIPVAEKTGLMIDVGNFVLKEVCRFISENKPEELGYKYIEVNLSVVQCLQRDFSKYVEEITQKYNVDHKYICFEITETASNCSPEIFTQNLEELVANGFKLALDDFGSGYGNLERMVTSPLAIVKFDKNMTDRVCSGEKMRQAFNKMVSLIKSIDLKIVSEGVETKEQYEFLRKVGVDYIQGYYFSKPLPEKDYIAFLKEHKK